VLHPQSWVAALIRYGEYRGLPVETDPESKSSKFHVQPLRYQSGSQRLFRLALSLPLAGRTTLQMDQTASSDQAILWHYRVQ